MAAKLERTYVVPLRREALKVPRYRRTPKAMRALQEFISRHMKSDDVRVGPVLNKTIWGRGIQSPPPRVKVQCVRDEEGVVRVELFGAPAFVKEEPKDEKKKDAKKSDKPAAAKKDDKAAEKKADAPKAEEKKDVKAEAKKDAPAPEKKEDKPAPKKE